jgi:phage baseplate assembly protein W
VPGYSPLLPLVTDPNDGIALTKTYAAVANQNLKMLVLTIPGERVMEPEFGVGLKKYLFENAGVELDAAIRQKILEQVNKYLPYIEILSIDFNDSSAGPTDIDRNILSVGIRYFVKPLDLEDVLEVLLDF